MGQIIQQLRKLFENFHIVQILNQLVSRIAPEGPVQSLGRDLVPVEGVVGRLGSFLGRLVGVLWASCERLGAFCARFSCEKVARFRHASLDCNFHEIFVRFCF